MTPRKLLAALFIMLAACGKRGDPHPPVPVIPQPTSDLVVTQRANRVFLAWSYPSLTTTGRSLTDIRRISIYRYVEDPAGSAAISAAQFSKLGQRIDGIEKADLGAASAGTKLLYTDEPAIHAGRTIRITYAVITEGATAKSELSNLASIEPMVVAVPPAELHADAKPEGVVVTWKRPESAAGGVSAAPVIHGYNIFRTAPGQEPAELDSPINAAPIEGETYTDVPPYGDHEYRVSAVAADRIQSDLSAPARASFKDLVAPPAPASITALLETNAVRLLWDAVEAPDLAGYRVYRSEGVGHGENIRDIGTFALVGEIITSTTITDTNPNLGIAYRYAVTSVDKSGNESARVWTEWVVAPKTP